MTNTNGKIPVKEVVVVPGCSAQPEFGLMIPVHRKPRGLVNCFIASISESSLNHIIRCCVYFVKITYGGKVTFFSECIATKPDKELLRKSKCFFNFR